MEACSPLQNRRFCPTLNSAVLSHFKNRRFCPVSKIGSFVSFKIGCFVLLPKILFENKMARTVADKGRISESFFACSPITNAIYVEKFLLV